MKNWILGLVLSVFAVGAFAGFIDERKPAHSPTAAVAAAGAATAAGFSVLKSDQSVRETLTRWANLAGWTHSPEHWVMAEDYSVAGTAGPEVFGTDFKSAVRILIASTDLTSRPAQPCFYANRVIRVIPRAGICDPSAQ